MMDGTRNATAGERGSTLDLLQRLAEGVPSLFRKETQLLKAEANEAGTRVAMAVGLIAGAAILSLVALNVLAGALVKAVVNAGLGAGWAALIVGGVFGLIALVMGLKGQSDLKAAKLQPERTVRTLRDDAAAAREAAR